MSVDPQSTTMDVTSKRTPKSGFFVNLADGNQTSTEPHWQRGKIGVSLSNKITCAMEKSPGVAFSFRESKRSGYLNPREMTINPKTGEEET